MSLSVVIVHYETPDLLLGCLESLRQHGEGLVGEILVVDNSRERPASDVTARFPGVKLVRNPENAGFARAVNQGIRATAGEWVLVLNPDTRVRAGALAELARFGQAHADAGIVAPKLFNPDGTLQHSCRRFYTLRTLLYRRTFLARWMGTSRVVREHLMLDFDHASPRAVDWVLGGAMLVRRAAAADVGGMDERFFLYFEDVDWCYRMGKRGWKVWYVPSAQLEHHHRRESVRDLKGLKRHVVSSLRFYEKWSLVLYVAKQGRGRMRSLATLASDLVALNLAFFLSFLLRGRLAFTLTKPLFPFAYYRDFLVLINVVSLGSLLARGLYRARHADWAELLVDLGKALAWASLIVMAATYVAYVKSYSRALMLLFFPISVCAVFLGRLLVARALSTLGERLGARRRALLAGMEPVLGQAARLLEGGDPSREWCGRVDLDRMGQGLDSAARRERLSALIRDERIQSVVLACPAARADECASLAERCRTLSQELFFFTEFTPWIREGDHVESLGPVRMLRATGTLPAESSPLARRVLAVAVAAILILPALALLALAWLGLLLGGKAPRFAAELWDNGRGETLRSWRLRGRGEAEGFLDRAGVSRALLLVPVLSGRLRLVGGPLACPSEAPRAGSEEAGLTGEWFVARRDGPGLVEYLSRAHRADVTQDLRILARSAARLWTRAFGRAQGSAFAK